MPLESIAVTFRKGDIMSYTALYRKFRPSTFDQVKGQDHIVQTLKNQINANRIGHAYLFCGTRGTGKTSVAKIFAKAVNCEHPVDGSPCNECETCRGITNGSAMNVIEIDAASNNGVDNIRQIRDEIQYSPSSGKYTVYIIDEVHMLSIGAFNALLKTLEEPPAYVIFILATTEPHKIPITILSRCQRYDFKRISIDTIAARLSELMEKESIEVEDKAIRYVAKAADGSMRDALSLLDQCIAFYLGQKLTYDNVLDVLGAVDNEIFSRLTRSVIDSDVTTSLNILDEIIMQGREPGQFVNDFIWYLRNLLLVKTTDDESKLADIIDVSEDSLAQLKSDSSKIDEGTLMRYIRVLSDLSNELKFSTQKRIKLEVTIIKMCKPSMEKNDSVEELAGRVTLLENNLEKTCKELESGAFAVSSPVPSAGASISGTDGIQSQKPVEKRVIEALPDDVRQIAASWNGIINTIDDPMYVAFLRQCHVTLAKDGISLEIMVKSTSAYNAISREEEVNRLIDVIEERTGIKVNIIITKLADDEDFQNRFTDIRELVNMDIEVDDKEEYI